MGDRNHLHVCRHCGLVHATSSSTAPESCTVCKALTFSQYELNDVLHGHAESRVNEPDDGQSIRTSDLFVRS
ncbi:hypothetical protein [Halobellus captivus]|uniref:hypothetical protein n=1 Tax=Halobellus captivus TaxID=2592614 RepID=UPI00119E1F70|nr:hypothetical protein [Halobellus captivus]